MGYQNSIEVDLPYKSYTLDDTTARKVAPLAVGSGTAAVIESQINFSFPGFVSSRRNKSFAFELWFRPIKSAGEVVLLGHGQGDGLIYDGRKIIFRLKLTVGDVEVSYEPENIQTFHVIGEYSPFDLKLYVNGKLVDSYVFTEEERAAEYISFASPESLQSGNANFSYILDAIAIYTKPIPPTMPERHYLLGTDVSAIMRNVSQFGGSIIELNNSKLTLVTERNWSGQKWAEGLLDNVTYVTDKLRPTVVGGQWSGYLESEEGVKFIIEWKGRGDFLVESFDGVWSECTNGNAVIGSQVRITFGSLDAEISELTAKGFQDQPIYAAGSNRFGQITRGLSHDLFYPIENKNSIGAESPIFVPAGETFSSVEFWIKPGNESQYLFDSRYFPLETVATNVVRNTSGEKTTGEVTVRTNLFTNPRAVNGTNWTSIDSSKYVKESLSAGGVDNEPCVQTTRSGVLDGVLADIYFEPVNVSAELEYTGSVHIESEKSALVVCSLRYRDAGGVIIGDGLGQEYSLEPGSLTRIDVTSLAPVNTVKVTCKIRVTSADVVLGDKVKFSGGQVEQSTVLSEYFNGESSGCVWAGTPNASDSLQKSPGISDMISYGNIANAGVLYASTEEYFSGVQSIRVQALLGTAIVLGLRVLDMESIAGGQTVTVSARLYIDEGSAPNFLVLGRDTPNNSTFYASVARSLVTGEWIEIQQSFTIPADRNLTDIYLVPFQGVRVDSGVGFYADDVTTVVGNYVGSFGGDTKDNEFVYSWTGIANESKSLKQQYDEAGLVADAYSLFYDGPLQQVSRQVYINGVSGTDLKANEWSHVVAVLGPEDKPYTFGAHYNGSLVGGRLGTIALHRNSLTAEDVGRLYRSYFKSSLTINESSSLSIIEPTDAFDLYGYEWSMTGAG